MQLYDAQRDECATRRAGRRSPARHDGAAGAAQRLRRRADPRADRGVRRRRRRRARGHAGRRGQELLGGRRRRLDAQLDRAQLRGERRRRAAAADDAGDDRLVPGAGPGSRAGPCARRRLRPRGLRRHRRRGARRAVRLLRGQARDHPGGDLAVRAGEDRTERGAALLPHRRALRRGDALRIGLVHEVAEDLDAAVELVLAELRTAGPEAARHAKKLVLERPDGLGTERRSPSGGRATRARRACAPSSRSATPRGHRKAPRSQPGRDRAAGLPGLPRARDRDGGGRAGGRRRVAARALGRRDRGDLVLPRAGRAHPRGASETRRRRDPSRLRVPRRERGLRGGSRGRGPDLGRPAARGAAGRRRQARGQAARARGRRARRAGGRAGRRSASR